MSEYTSAIYHYLKKYQEDPSSRVFAPLAEAYRKAGLVDEAIEIAQEGLRIHPAFVAGKVALARAFFDKKNYEKVTEELRNVIQEVPDNLVAQRLYADSQLILGNLVDALMSYKMIFFYQPNDQELLQIVQELESEAYKCGALKIKDTLKGEPAVKNNETTLGVKQNHLNTLQGLLGKVGAYRDKINPGS